METNDPGLKRRMEDSKGVFEYCAKWCEPIHAYVEGLLKGAERGAVVRHLKTCKGCRRLDKGFRDEAKMMREYFQGKLRPYSEKEFLRDLKGVNKFLVEFPLPGFDEPGDRKTLLADRVCTYFMGRYPALEDLGNQASRSATLLKIMHAIEVSRDILEQHKIAPGSETANLRVAIELFKAPPFDVSKVRKVRALVRKIALRLST